MKIKTGEVNWKVPSVSWKTEKKNSALSSDRLYEKRLCTPRAYTDKNEFVDLAHKISAVKSAIKTMHTHTQIWCEEAYF